MKRNHGKKPKKSEKITAHLTSSRFPILHGNYCSMKYSLLLLLLFPALHSIAQIDTTLTYLDNDEKPCGPENARKYAIRNKESDHWKKVVFDALDDKPIYGAYYLDSACSTFDGLYSSFYKNAAVWMKGRY